MNDREKLLEGALKHIVRATTEWDANNLGGVHIQRRRWRRCGQIADEALIEAAAERIGATAELVTTGAQLADNELGTRTIISGGEVFEIREGTSSQQWFDAQKAEPFPALHNTVGQV